MDEAPHSGDVHSAPALPPDDASVKELRELLSRPLPELPPRYFYDDHGSALFDAITEQPEYYPTRTEEALLETIADRIMAMARPEHIAELGSGVGRKIRMLLDAGAGTLRTCTMLDINQLMLDLSVERLSSEYPDVRFFGVQGDFTRHLDRLGPGGRRLIIFLAGTLGNLHPAQVPEFLRRVRGTMAPDDALLLGVDLVKDIRRVEAAYNDDAGVTAAFNRNILAVINRRFGADFQPEAFEHRAFFDPDNAWIEMRLRATRPMRVRVPAVDLELVLDTGDELRTELSCKYTRETLAARAALAGLRLDHWFTDPEQLFALALVRP